jgi:hypothetical protein
MGVVGAFAERQALMAGCMQAPGSFLPIEPLIEPRPA